MSIDEQHVALPKLYGAPAYARPPRVVEAVPRPFDPDDLPIEAFQSDEDRAFAATLPARSWAPAGVQLADRAGAGRHDRPPSLVARRLTLRTIAGRLLESD